MKFNLKIEQLALHGIQLTPAEQAELKAALQSELGRLLASSGTFQNWAELDSLEMLKARPINYHPETSPTRLGRDIAVSLARGLSQPGITEKVYNDYE